MNAKKQIILTGIKPTGEPHIGNYAGAIKPALQLAQQPDISSYLFIADSHTLTSIPSPKELQDSVCKVAAGWLACGLDPDKTVFYRQSDIPELFELAWILSCATPKGLMNRAHSYKAQRDLNLKAGKTDKDDGVNMGLYNYPVLMTADILLFSPRYVPVGQDQAQHLEMARDIAQKFNRLYKKEIFTVPKAWILNEKSLPGRDGRKMSKSYKNEIPLFASPEQLKKLVRKIKTDSSAPDEPKNTENCLVFSIYQHFANNEEINSLKARYTKGISWGEAKDILFKKLEETFRDKKKIYDHYISHPEELEQILQKGAERAKALARDFLRDIKKSIGLIKQ